MDGTAPCKAQPSGPEKGEERTPAKNAKKKGELPCAAESHGISGSVSPWDASLGSCFPTKEQLKCPKVQLWPSHDVFSPVKTPLEHLVFLLSLAPQSPLSSRLDPDLELF